MILDGNGRQTQLIDDRDDITPFSYDLLYRRTLLHDETGGYDIAAWSFFGPARVAQVQLGNGLVCTWMNNAGTNSAVQPGVPNPGWTSGDFLGYDGAGRMIAKRYMTSDLSTLRVGFSTEFDRAGNKFFERALHAPDRSSLYEPFIGAVPQGGYDSLDRLLQYQRGTLASTGGFNDAGGGSITTAIGVPHTDTQRTYDLDGLGNWRQTAFTPVPVSPSPPTAQTEVRQHNGLNQITRLQNPLASELINPTYDKNGNLTADGAATYSWDALNRLVGAGSVAQYVYDALNRRIRKTVSGAVTDCVYSGWQCVEDRDVSNSPSVQYLWGIYLDEIIQQMNIAAINGFAAGALLYPLQDLLYRTTGLADSSGTVLEAYDTDAYGNTLIFRSSPPAQIVFSDSDPQVSVPTCPFIFTGQRFDTETGLYYYKRRYYSPVLGRFLSRDPIGRPTGSASLYWYVAGSPVQRFDPFGLQGYGAVDMPAEGIPIALILEAIAAGAIQIPWWALGLGAGALVAVVLGLLAWRIYECYEEYERCQTRMAGGLDAARNYEACVEADRLGCKIFCKPLCSSFDAPAGKACEKAFNAGKCTLPFLACLAGGTFVQPPFTCAEANGVPLCVNNLICRCYAPVAQCEPSEQDLALPVSFQTSICTSSVTPNS